ncbi:uncharacterized protein LOC125498729 [Beta vulgaris subsp. vulgaris]|uniref:uncharacterized protein LOC125498729 n=1 Tax=Beta vulgaris subsp. vulgaris TaxID=3555 RepID=UPI002036707D|nr:uncharacterized protein LOC125498729 [Beta vulgaris subsp. vulgaris]
MPENTQNTNTQIDPAQDPSSPYYVHPSDSQYKLVNNQFNGSGYNDWKRSVIIGLSAKNKLGFIDGTITKPSSTSPLLKAWTRCNSTLIAWFTQILDVTIARSVLYFETAQEICLQQQIADLDQESDSVSSFYTKLKMIWDDLDAHNPLPICTCNNCTCDVTRKVLKMQEDQRLTLFLMKLREEFKQARGTILMQHPLASLSHAYRLLMQEERHKEVYVVVHNNDEPMAFNASNTKKRFYDQASESDKYGSSYNRSNIGDRSNTGDRYLPPRVSYQGNQGRRPFCNHL